MKGSSAAGEQPKFTARQRNGDRFIVKFSPPRGTPFGERWHQLLHLEKRALQTLEANGIACAQTEIVKTARRTCLASRRFDRGLDRGASGAMRHIVSAAAVHDEFVHAPRINWVATCEALVKQNMMAATDARKVTLSYLFGQFIGNTDMHFGNLSFFVADVVNPVFVPTPVYDMLPMMWGPDIHSGNLDPSSLREPLLPIGYAAEAALARAWATGYWQQASVDVELGAELRSLCVENARRLQHGFD
ncbi:MAG: HipA domain-containing protein [Polaromonas sp.]